MRAADQGHRLADERGIGLVELLIAMTLTLALLGASVSILTVSFASKDRTGARAETTDTVQIGVARMVRELHAAERVRFFTSQLVDVQTFVAGGNGATYRVRYDCGTDEVCRRSEPDRPGAPSTVVAGGVLNPDVFAPEPDFLRPTYIAVRLRLQVEGASQPVTVSDGTSLPNLR